MQQLSNIDASWLHGETEKTPFHVGNALMFEKPKAGLDLQAALRELLANKLAHLPVLHRRLDPLSLKLANPVWINDPDLHWNYHVQRATVAAPGGRDQFNELLVQLHRPMLDRNHPLWQVWLIEGLKGGAFALYVKLHHAASDGGAANILIETLFSGVADPAPQTLLLKEQERQPMELLWSTAMNYYVETPRKMASVMKQMLQATTVNANSGATLDTSQLKDLMPKAPKTPFNTGLTAERSYGMSTVPLAEVKALGKAHGGTVNDAVLAICTGALRSYLEKRKQLPAQPLVVGMPVSVRGEGDATANNQISMMLPILPVQEADPSKWMPAIRKSVSAAKKWQEATRPIARLQVEMPSLRMPLFNNLGSMMEAFKMAEDLRMTDRMPPFVNVWISNVPGSRTPLMFAGMPARTNIPVGLVMHGAALNITIFSYLDRIEFGVLSCPNAVPDAQEIADLLVAQLGALQEVAA